MGKLSRLKLQETLEQVLGSKNVYFQPPESMRLKYPCIVYGISSGDTIFANNVPYKFDISYQVTERQFKTEDMNHDIFRIYI